MNSNSNQVFKENMTISQWWSFLEELTDIEPQKTTKFNSIFGMLGVFLIILSFDWFNFEQDAFLNFIFWIGISLFIINYLYYRKYKKSNTQKLILTYNQLKINKMVMAFLIYLKDHIQEDVKIELDIILSDPIISENLKKNKKIENGYVEYYEQIWLNGNTILNDGTKIYFSFKDVIAKKLTSKTNTNGKNKSKVKYTFKTKYKIKLGFSYKKYIIPEVNVVEKDNKRFYIKTKGFQKLKSLRNSANSFDPLSFSKCLWQIYKNIKLN